MNTNNSTTDIIMEILEGKTLELYKVIFYFYFAKEYIYIYFFLKKN
jgi:hypothetical protein